MMKEETIRVVGKVVSSIVSTLVVGEVFGSAISRPIQAWRLRGIDESKLFDLIDEMNQRICDLEDLHEEEA